MKPTGNARQMNVNAVNAMKRLSSPTAPNNAASRNKTKTEAAASRPAKTKR